MTFVKIESKIPDPGFGAKGKTRYLGLDQLSNVKTKREAFSENVPIDDMVSIHRSGFTPGLQCGIDSLDKIFTWRPGFQYLFSGYPLAGKSEMVNYLSVLWCKRAPSNKVCVYSPENYPAEYFFSDIVKAHIGKPIEAKWSGAATEAEIRSASQWVQDNYDIMNFYDVPTLDSILNYWQDRVTEGFNFFMIDPLNAIVEGGAMGSGNSISKYTKLLFTQLKLFASSNKVIILLVEHPNRPERNTKGNYPKVNVHSIYGGAGVFNKLDCIVILHREGNTLDDNEIIWETAKMKRQNLNGQPGERILYFNWKTGCYSDRDPFDYQKKVKAL